MRSAGITLVALVACNGPPGSGGSFASMEPPVTSVDGGSSGAGSSSTGSSSGGESGTSTSGEVSTGGEVSTTIIKGDLGGGDFGPIKPGCQGKVDFLFVIDSDYSMWDEQQKLLASFPGFMAAIEALGSDFAAFDFHVMALDGSTDWGNSLCNEDCTPEGCMVADYPCDLLDTVTVCDEKLGAGHVFNAGTQAFNAPCVLAGGNRYITREQADLEAAFTCVAQVGLSGGAQRPGQAIAEAFHPSILGEKGCNAGFVRDDALLVVSYIGGTEGTSMGLPDEWANAVKAAKGGREQEIVMLAIQPFASLEACLLYPDDWGDLCRMLEEFPYRVYGQLHGPEYVSAFEEAVGLIDEACENVAPG